MFEIGLSHYLTVAAALFAIGIFGIFINRKNVIVILMSVELMLLAVNVNLVAGASRPCDGPQAYRGEVRKRDPDAARTHPGSRLRMEPSAPTVG